MEDSPKKETINFTDITNTKSDKILNSLNKFLK